MKRMLTFILIVICMLICGCKKINETSDYTLGNENSEEQTEDMVFGGDTEENSGGCELTSRAIIRPDFQMILKDNGKVIAKGVNEYGQLGNGSRTYSSDWCEVNLENVVGIYALWNFGYNDNTNKIVNGRGVYGYDKVNCFALTKSGELYRWGGNILTPQKIDDFPAIEEIVQPDKWLIILRCKNGQNYIIRAADIDGYKYIVLNYNELEKDACLYWCGGDFLYTKGTQISYIDMNFDKIVMSRDFENIRDFQEGINKTETIDCGQNIIGCGGVLLLTESGNALRITANSDMFDVEDMGGNLIKKIYYDGSDNAFLLFEDGQLKCQGKNEDGQLGDGTNLDYYNGYLDINVSTFSDFYFDVHSDFVVAMDDSRNIWAWGYMYGNTPSIIVDGNIFSE